MGSIWEWLSKLLGGGSRPPAGGYVIAVDPGHGGRFSGATVDHPFRPGSQVEEKEITLDIALKLGELLRQDGHQVIFTRETDDHLADDQNADLAARANIANQAGAEVFVSIHCNASENTNASGIETYHFPGSSRGAALAREVQKSLLRTFPDHHDRGVKAENFAVLRLTSMPSCLVETEFMTNRQSLIFLLDPQNQQAIGRAIRDGIYAYFEG